MYLSERARREQDPRWETTPRPTFHEKRLVTDILDQPHQQSFKRAIANILSSEIAEETYAQIIDGRQLASVAFGNTVFGWERWDPVWNHQKLCDGVLERTRSFRDNFDPLTLKLDLRVLKEYQKHPADAEISELPFIELIAVAVHIIAVDLYKLDLGLHKGEPLMGEDPYRGNSKNERVADQINRGCEEYSDDEETSTHFYDPTSHANVEPDEGGKTTKDVQRVSVAGESDIDNAHLDLHAHDDVHAKKGSPTLHSLSDDDSGAIIGAGATTTGVNGQSRNSDNVDKPQRDVHTISDPMSTSSGHSEEQVSGGADTEISSAMYEGVLRGLRERLGMRAEMLSPFSVWDYEYHEQYPEGIADMVGYWAEDRIFGGVVIFKRGSTPYEDGNVWFHSHRDGVTYRPYALTHDQRTNFYDFLQTDADSQAPCPLPILATADNDVRVDPEVAIPDHNIYRDRWERKISRNIIHHNVMDENDYPPPKR